MKQQACTYHQSVIRMSSHLFPEFAGPPRHAGVSCLDSEPRSRSCARDPEKFRNRWLPVSIRRHTQRGTLNTGNDLERFQHPELNPTDLTH